MNYVALTLVLVFVLVAGTLYALGAATFPIMVLFGVSAACIGAMAFTFGLFIHQDAGSWAYSLASPVGLLVGAWVTLSTLTALINHKGITWRGSTYK